MVLERKGSYDLVKYNGGFFGLDYNTPSIGMGLIFSKDEKMVREKFLAINETLSPKENGYN